MRAHYSKGTNLSISCKRFFSIPFFLTLAHTNTHAHGVLTGTLLLISGTVTAAFAHHPTGKDPPTPRTVQSYYPHQPQLMEGSASSKEQTPDLCIHFPSAPSSLSQTHADTHTHHERTSALPRQTCNSSAPGMQENQSHRPRQLEHVGEGRMLGHFVESHRRAV